MTTAANSKLTSTKMAAILNAAGIHPDSLVRRGSVFTARRSYFYRSSTGLQYLANAISAIPGAKVVETTDEFRHWPKTSYYRIDFTFEPPAAAKAPEPESTTAAGLAEMKRRADAADRASAIEAGRFAALNPPAQAPAAAPEKTYPVRLFWVYDPANVTDALDKAQLIIAASPSCAIGKACDHDAALAARSQHLHSSIASFSR